MNVQDSREITEHLQKKDVQARIQKLMQEARSKATVTISRAANLFNFSESQLREWEKRGLLKTDRSLLSQDGKTSTGHRQFSPDELDKLALIRELMDQGYTISEIPHNIDVIWKQIFLTEQQYQASSTASHEIKQVHEVEHIPIDKRVGRTNEEVFWRYFVSQVLRLSLMLLCEDMLDTKAGLIIPLQKKEALKKNYLPGDQPEVGPSLVGWLDKNCSFYSFLDAAPSFQFPSDYRIQLLPIGGDKRQDNVLIVLQREARTLSPSVFLVETIRRLLELLYQHVEQWQSCFDFGMRDWEYQVTDFTNPNAADEVLNSLADIIVELGEKHLMDRIDGASAISSCHKIPHFHCSSVT